MSGLPLDQALNRETLALVQGTAFGRVWTVRLVLIAALCGALVTIRRSTSERLRSHLSVGALVLAAAYVAALAFAGHAAGGQDRVVQIVFDGLHLLSAGAWIGALPGLVLFLDGTRPLDDAVRVTRRFSTLALGSVGVLVVSGLINAWYLVGDAAALVGTDYGRLLLAKLALFGTMATLAMANRWYLIPRITANDGAALQSLRRNAILETAGGIAVVTVVGALGITVPAAHGTPMWPFARTLSLQAAEQAAWVGAVLGAAGVVAFAAGRRGARWIAQPPAGATGSPGSPRWRRRRWRGSGCSPCRRIPQPTLRRPCATPRTRSRAVPVFTPDTAADAMAQPVASTRRPRPRRRSRQRLGSTTTSIATPAICIG